MKKLIFIVSLFLVPTMVTAAECSDERFVELKNEAAEIKLNYETAQEFYDPSEIIYPEDVDTPEEKEAFNKLAYENYLKLNFINISENFYVELTNNINDDVISISYDDTTDGSYSIDHHTVLDIYTYTMTIYISDEADCGDDAIVIKYLETPIVNQFFSRPECEGHEEEAVCQQYITNENLTESSFLSTIRELDAEKEGNTVNETDNDDSFIEKYSVFLVVVLCILLAGTAVFVYNIYTRRRKK